MRTNDDGLAPDLPQETADQLTQTFSVLTFEVPTQGTSTNANTNTSRQSLIDIDADGYLEQTQWVRANQALLAIATSYVFDSCLRSPPRGNKPILPTASNDSIWRLAA